MQLIYLGLFLILLQNIQSVKLELQKNEHDTSIYKGQALPDLPAEDSTLQTIEYFK